MAERLYLSYWLRGFAEQNMLQHFETVLRRFPFSATSPTARAFKIYALEYAEPPLLERLLDQAADAGEVIEAAREFHNADCCYLVEGHWDLWQFAGGWRLTPSPVSLVCHGPKFTSDLGDHLRIEVGLDAHFLPQPQYPESASRVRSNIKGLLRLAHELDDCLPVENRRLWSESGESFAERLQAAVS